MSKTAASPQERHLDPASSTSRHRPCSLPAELTHSLFNNDIQSRYARETAVFAAAMLSKVLAALLPRRQARPAVKEDKADYKAGGTTQKQIATVNEAKPVLVTLPPEEQWQHHAHPPAASPNPAKKRHIDHRDVVYSTRDLIPTCYHYRVYGKGKHRLTEAKASVACGKYEECWRPRFTGSTAMTVSNMDGTPSSPPAAMTGNSDSLISTEPVVTNFVCNNNNFSDPSPTNYMLKRGEPIANLRYWMGLRLPPNAPPSQQRKNSYLRDPIFKPEHLRAVTLDGLGQFKELHEENLFLLAWAKREMFLACSKEQHVLSNAMDVADKIAESIHNETSETDDSEDDILRTPDSAGSGNPHFEEAAWFGRDNLARRKVEAQNEDLVVDCMVVADLLDQMVFLNERIDRAIVKIKLAQAKDGDESERKLLDRIGVDWRV